jgi:hypothetical protein
VNDDDIIVTIEWNGARVYQKNRVLVRYELPDFEGAQVVIDFDSDDPIQGRINFVDLMEFEQYARCKGIKYRTGEIDPMGMKRIIEEVREESRPAKKKREFSMVDWAENRD